MSCRICGRNSCTESFHSLKAIERQDRIDSGECEDCIDKDDEIEQLQAENEALHKEGMTIYAMMNDKRVEQLQSENEQLRKDLTVLFVDADTYDNQLSYVDKLKAELAVVRDSKNRHIVLWSESLEKNKELKAENMLLRDFIVFIDTWHATNKPNYTEYFEEDVCEEAIRILAETPQTAKVQAVLDAAMNYAQAEGWLGKSKNIEHCGTEGCFHCELGLAVREYKEE